MSKVAEHISGHVSITHLCNGPVYILDSKNKKHATEEQLNNLIKNNQVSGQWSIIEMNFLPNK